MGFFSGQVKDAKMFGGGNNIRDGIYRLRVESFTERVNHKKEGQFIAEFRVIEAAANGEMQIAADGRNVTDKPVTPNQVGTTCSIVISSKHESAAGNVKKCLLGVLSGLGYTEDDIDSKIYDESVSTAQPLRGADVIVETYRTVNQGKTTQANAGKILVLPKFIAIEQTEASIMSGRTWLDANKAKAAPAAAPAETTESKAPGAPAVASTPAPGSVSSFLGRKGA